MKKSIVLALIVILTLAVLPASALAEPEEFKVIRQESAGPQVMLIQMRLRDLGYFHYRPTGQFGSLTRIAVMRFQENNKLDKDGDVGKKTYDKLFLNSLKRCPLGEGVKPPHGPGDDKKAKVYGSAEDWFSVVSNVFRTGMTAEITDFYSGAVFSMKRTGGQNHAEVETPTKDDYKKYLKCFGNAKNWEKRPVTVKIGEAIYAASLFGWPHGADTISDNGMSGHTCLYFSGSCSHVMGLHDVEHEAMIRVAVAK